MPTSDTTWRYAFARELTDEGDIHWSIREVYTDPDGGLSWTEDWIEPHGEKWTELADDIARMASAAGTPFLDLTVDPPRMRPPSERSKP